uniref:RHD domain-containing protein n=1 Tax=Lygus hesperus TaxID=30085 RepID=A0A0A9WIP5_LYGHE
MWSSPLQTQPELHHLAAQPVFLMQYDQNSSNSNFSMEYDESHQILDLDSSPSASHGSYAMSPDSGYGGDDPSGVRPTTSGTTLAVVEQPENSYRFRYKKESQKPHGPLKGKNSAGKTQKNSNGPRVKLNNFSGEAIIRCWLYSQTDEEGPSPHRLVQVVGKTIVDEPIDIKVDRSNNYTATFDRMNILHVVTNDEPYQKCYLIKKERLGRNGSIISHPDLAKFDVNITNDDVRNIKNRWKKINKDICTLRFEAYQKKGDKYQFIDSILSSPIKNKKSPKTNGLRIVKASHLQGPCTGKTEILIFTEKLIKDVRIIFFDDDGWECYADFKESDIHKQVALAFRTPPYKNLQITEAVTVYYKIQRTTDGEESNDIAFRYLPTEDNLFLLENVPVKRKKPQVTRNCNLLSNDPMLSDATAQSEMDDTMDILNCMLSPVDDSDELLNGNLLSDVSTGDLIQDSIPIAMYGTFCKDSVPAAQDMGAEKPDVKEAESLDEKARRLQKSIWQDDWSTFCQLISTPNIVNFKYGHQTSLHCAVKYNRPRMVSKLLEMKADVYELDNNGSNTALHLAILSPSHSCLQLLLQEVKPKQIFNKDGDDPVLYATRNGCYSALEMLLLKEFPPVSDNKKNGDTPLHVAVENCIKSGGTTEIVDLLLKYGASASEYNYDAKTPLHYAVAAQHDELVQKLIPYSDANDYEEEDDEDELSSRLKLLELADAPIIKSRLSNFFNLSDDSTENKQTSEPFLALDGDVELSKKVATRLGCAFLIPFLVNSEKQSQLLLNHLQRKNDLSTAVALLNGALAKE